MIGNTQTLPIYSSLIRVSAILGCMHLRNASEARFQLVKTYEATFWPTTPTQSQTSPSLTLNPMVDFVTPFLDE